MTSGRIGEDMAERLYRRRGYSILARNYSVRGGELDIVAYRFGVLVFAEVKTRSGDLFGTPLEAVDDRKIRRLQNAEWQFLHEHMRRKMIPVYSRLLGKSIYKPILRMRNDVASVYLSDTKKEITIYKNVFDVPVLD